MLYRRSSVQGVIPGPGQTYSSYGIANGYTSEVHSIMLNFFQNKLNFFQVSNRVGKPLKEPKLKKLKSAFSDHLGLNEYTLQSSVCVIFFKLVYIFFNKTYTP